VNWWDRFLWHLGFAICHQQPDRLLRFGNHSLFVCARDTGLFVSFFSVLLVVSLLRGRRRGGIWWPLVILALAGIAFLAWDGLSSYLGYRETSNLLRFLSGLSAGTGLAILFAPWINRTVFGGDRRSKLGRNPIDLSFIILALGLMAGLYLLRPQSLFTLAETWLALCIIGTFWSLNLLLVSLLREKRSPALSLSNVLLALLLAVLELGGSYALHRAILHRGPGPPV
jgi:uncharacterized membrane protein